MQLMVGLILTKKLIRQLNRLNYWSKQPVCSSYLLSDFNIGFMAMEYEPHDPEFWIQFPPDEMLSGLLSEVNMFITSIDTNNFILSNIDKDKTPEIDEGLQRQRERIEAMSQIVKAVSNWITVYRQNNPPSEY